MKRLAPLLLLLLCANVAFADTAPSLGIQSLFKTAPKPTESGPMPRLVGMQGNTLVQLPLSSAKPALATTATAGIVKIGSGISVTTDGTISAQQGQSGTIAIGTTTTGTAGTNATVTNSGTSTNAVLNFTIPRGPQGIQGVQGVQGVQGAAGGSTNWRGDWTAYTQYANNDAVSYQGSSYIALTDVDGIAPPDPLYWNLLASKGAAPVKGVDYFDGAKGNDGYTPVKGVDYFDGAKGDKGDKGDTGAAGGTVAFKGAWSSVVNYVALDVVTYNGSSYVAKAPSLNISPTVTTSWQLMAQKGTDGTPGAQGQQGIQGIPGADGPNIVNSATTTTYTDLLKGNGSIVQQAVPGTDYLRPDGNGSALTNMTKTQVGLPNADNTSDLAKPISTATQTALDTKHNTTDLGIYLSPSGGDDTTAFQAAITAATASSRKVILKAGVYLISIPIMLPSSQITITGESFAIYGNSGVVIRATAPMVAMFRFGDSGTSRASTYENLYLDGNSLAQHGFLAGSSDGSTFYTTAYMQWTNVEIVKTTTSAWTVGGWNNVWRRCYTNVNTGNGIVMTGTQNNACEINDSDLDANDGWGLVYYGGTGLTISGKSSIQMNKKGGIYVVGSATGLSIDAYFERNAQTGYALTTPAKTVKTDILINSGAAGSELVAASTGLNFGINIVGSTFIDNYADNPLTLIGKARTIRFIGNTGSAAYARAAIAFELDASYHETRSLEYRSNSNFTAPFNVTKITSQSAALVPGASSQINIPMWRNWTVEDLPGMTSGNAPFYSIGVPHNIFPTSATGMSPLGIQATLKGTIAQAAASQWPNPKTPAFEITLDNTTSSDVFGASYRSSDYPDWVGKPIYFSADLRDEDDTTVQGALYWRVVWDSWAGNTAYTVGQRAFVGGSLYEVTTAGTSAASGGPTGTGTGIADGTAVWKYIAANATSTGQDVIGGTMSLTQWQAREVRFVWPNAGATVYVGVRAPTGGATGKRILFTRPVLAPVGLPSHHYWNDNVTLSDLGAGTAASLNVIDGGLW